MLLGQTFTIGKCFLPSQTFNKYCKETIVCLMIHGKIWCLSSSSFVEPMLTMGSIHPILWPDNWTAVTEDGSLSAQFEHTILITEDGAEILTKC